MDFMYKIISFLIISFYMIILMISPFILISKLRERNEEKKKENLEKYKKY